MLWQGTSSWPVGLPEEKGAGAQTCRTGGKEAAPRKVRASQADGVSRVHGNPKLGRLWQTLALRVDRFAWRLGQEMCSCPHRSMFLWHYPRVRAEGSKEECGWALRMPWGTGLA